MVTLVTQIFLPFLRYLDLEYGYDYLNITRADGSVVASRTGWETHDSSSPITVTDTDAVHITFTTDGSVQYFGFWLRYWVFPEPAGGGIATPSPPPPTPPPPSPPPPPLAPLCDANFVAQGLSYMPAGPRWITSDMRARLTAGGIAVGQDSSASPLVLPALPSGSAATWLQPYRPNTACAWEFRVPAGAVMLLNIRWGGVLRTDTATSHPHAGRTNRACVGCVV